MESLASLDSLEDEEEELLLLLLSLEDELELDEELEDELLESSSLTSRTSFFDEGWL